MSFMYVNVNGPQSDLWPDYTDPNTPAGEPVYGRGRTWARGDVGMRAVEGVHSASGLNFVYTKDYDDGAAGTVDWRKNYFVLEASTEEGGFMDVAVFTGACAQDKQGRAVRYGKVWVKCNLASTAVTADMAFKVTDGQVYLSPAEAGSSGAARIVAKATKAQTAPGTGVQLVECHFCGVGAGLGVRFT